MPDVTQPGARDPETVSKDSKRLVWARGAALAGFMQYLRANLSKKVGRLVDWSGSFWERRYSAEPVLDDEALVGRLRYVLAHGVPGSASVPVVQLDEALEQEGARGHGGRGGAFRRGNCRASGVVGDAPAVLGRTGGGGEAARGAGTRGAGGSRGSRTGQAGIGGTSREGPAPAYPARAPQAQPAAVGTCLYAPGIEGGARAVPGLRRGIPRGGGSVEVGELLSSLPALLLPSACHAGSRHSNSLTPSA